MFLPRSIWAYHGQVRQYLKHPTKIQSVLVIGTSAIRKSIKLNCIRIIKYVNEKIVGCFRYAFFIWQT